MRTIASMLFILLASAPTIFGQPQPLTYYLPDMAYDPSIPTPAAFLGYEVGDWHVTHDKLVYYMQTLANASDRIEITEYARSHERRPLYYLTITSPGNHSNLDGLKTRHNMLADPEKSASVKVDDIPIVVYQGYSIHGNESSGSNAALLVAYYLAAGQSAEIDNLLSKAIILLDPCYNPDGLQRFSTWVNMHKHKTLTSDPRDREFNEVWPGGRTNHYWFDLNRDWMFNIHPESKGRLEVFHEWKPDILTDHHEMGSNSTFFFQPGIPSRTNPNTPQLNQKITEDIGRYHAAALDSIGSLYYSKEQYDDYYYGKGSSYPDINGCIGILFEQASSRGHLRETVNGMLSFPFTIRNQVVTSLSTQKAAIGLKKEILNFKRSFYRDRGQQKTGIEYVFQSEDPYTNQFFIDILRRHQIEVYRLKTSTSLGSTAFDKNKAFVVPRDQRQSTLVKTIFEKVLAFPDSLFYDVSAWTLPLAFNMDYAESSKENLKGALVQEDVFETPPYTTDQTAYAYLMDWSQFYAPAALHKLLDLGVLVKIPKRNSVARYRTSDIQIQKGTVIIPLANQNIPVANLVDTLERLNKDFGLAFQPISSGLSDGAYSVGSPQMRSIEKPKVAMVIGEGINAYEAGAAWHTIDTRFQMPVTMIDKIDLHRADLTRYTVIILPDGRYADHEMPKEKLEGWLENGGTLIAMRGAINYVNAKNWINIKSKSSLTPDNYSIPRYDQQPAQSGAQYIGGAIFDTKIDLTHPLLFGYKGENLPVFKRGTQFFEPSKNAFATPVRYTDNPVLSGYASKVNIEQAKNAASVICFGRGSGTVIAMVDNPNFRGYWLGGNKLFANAIFFNKLIDRRTLER